MDSRNTGPLPEKSVEALGRKLEERKAELQVNLRERLTESEPEARLQAYPTAKRCRPCQEIKEREVLKVRTRDGTLIPLSESVFHQSARRHSIRRGEN